MPRRDVKRNDYEAVGEWLLDYWEGFKIWEEDPNPAKSAEPPAPNVTALGNLIELDGATLSSIHDGPNLLNIVIPHCPWSKEDVQKMLNDRDGRASSKYKADLGFVIMGSCR
jgi:hypothetical protein